MISRICLSLLFLFAITAPANAADLNANFETISAAEFKKIIPGKTIVGEYRFLRARTNTYNFSEHHTTDGRSIYKEGSEVQNGKWYVLGQRKVCYKYDRGTEMAGVHCFWVFRDSGCYYSYGLSQMKIDQTPRDYNNWVARWVIKGSGATCTAPIS